MAFAWLDLRRVCLSMIPGILPSLPGSLSMGRTHTEILLKAETINLCTQQRMRDSRAEPGRLTGRNAIG